MRHGESLKPTPKVELTGRFTYITRGPLGSKIREMRIYHSDSQEPEVVWATGWREKTAIRRALRGNSVPHNGIFEELFTPRSERTKTTKPTIK